MSSTAARAAIPQIYAQAVAAHAAHDLQRAALICQHVLTIDPRHADSLHLFGVVLREQGHAAQALDLAERAIRVRPRDPAYHLGRGDALEALGRRDDAMAAWREAVRLDPRCVPALINLGDAHYHRKEAERAAEFHRRALAAAPNAVPALNGLASALQHMQQTDEAERLFRAALRLAPNEPVLHSNLGNLLRDLCRFDAAEACAKMALSLAPGHPQFLFGLALTYCAAERFSAAEPLLADIIARFPEHHEAHHTLAALQIIQGRFAEGLEHYEHRGWAEVLAKTGRPPEANWAGEDLAGRTLLVLADEGFGDFLMFCRFIPWAARQGKVVLEVPPPLVRLALRLPGIAQVVPAGAPRPRFDLRCSTTSLWRAARVTPATVPADIPYLFADPQDAAEWHARLAALPGLKVGLSWAGNPTQLIDRLRSITLAALAPLAGIAGVSFVSLQKNAPHEPPSGFVLHDWTGELLDFADTAALMQSLDLVISVDTAVVHLAGALGRPVWMLNRWDGASDPRWLLGREDSPWYPTLRIFRQGVPNDWSSVIAPMTEALRALAAQHSSAARRAA